MIIAWLCAQSKWENINFRTKRFSILLVNQIYELEPSLAIYLEIATQSGQEFSLKNYCANFKRQKFTGVGSKHRAQPAPHGAAGH